MKRALWQLLQQVLMSKDVLLLLLLLLVVLVVVVVVVAVVVVVVVRAQTTDPFVVWRVTPQKLVGGALIQTVLSQAFFQPKNLGRFSCFQMGFPPQPCD